METEQVFQDALLAKMAKTTELMSKLDTHKNGDADDRASKCLGLDILNQRRILGNIIMLNLHLSSLHTHQVPESA